MNTKIVAILCRTRDTYKIEADNLEKELEVAQLAVKAQNYKIRINRLRKLQLETQELITAEMQSALDEQTKMDQEYAYKTTTDIGEQNK